LVLGMNAQSFAMPMSDKTQSSLLQYAMTKNATLGQLMLVADPPMVKGGKTIYNLMPIPQKSVDGISVVPQTNSPELILANVPTVGGGTMLKLIPKPQEGIDGIFIAASTAMPSVSLQSESDPQTQMMLANVPTQSGGVIKLTPQHQYGIDGIIVPPSADKPIILVSEPLTSKGGMASLHFVPRPAPSPWDNSS
jgi:hypothetical protein